MDVWWPFHNLGPASRSEPWAPRRCPGSVCRLTPPPSPAMNVAEGPDEAGFAVCEGVLGPGGVRVRRSVAGDRPETRNLLLAGLRLLWRPHVVCLGRHLSVLRTPDAAGGASLRAVACVARLAGGGLRCLRRCPSGLPTDCLWRARSKAPTRCWWAVLSANANDRRCGGVLSRREPRSCVRSRREPRTCPHVQARAQTKVHGLYVPTKTAARFPSPRPIYVAGPTGLRRHRSKIKKSAEGVSTSPWNGAQCRSSGPADQSSGRDVRGSLLCEYPLLATKVAPLPGEHAPYSSVPRGEGQVLRLKHVVYGCEERDDVMILVVVVRPANHNMVV